MAHRGKKKEDKNLVFIEKSSDEQSSLTIGLRVISMYNSDFNLTIKEIGEILLCDRQWVVKYVKDNVKHIFLNETYRRFLFLIGNEYGELKSFLNDYYYFSRSDFYRWLKENTVVTRQTIMIDISTYCDDQQDYQIATKEYIKAKNEMEDSLGMLKINFQYYDKVYKLLNKTGKKYFENRVSVVERKANPVVLNNVELPSKFTSIKILKADINKSLEIVYRDLYKYGALKYTIANSLVRYDDAFRLNCFSGEYPFIITIPYEIL